MSDLLNGISSNYDSYRDYLDQAKYGDTVSAEGTTGAGKTTNWNMVVDEEGTNGISVDSFLKLMVTQLTNQDFMNPVDDTQFVTQLAQFSTLQQMQEMTSSMKNSYLLSLVGQTVTCAKFNVSGNLVKETGKVERVVLANNEFSLYVNGEKFLLSQLMELGEASKKDPTQDSGDEPTDGEDAGADDKAQNADSTQSAAK